MTRILFALMMLATPLLLSACVGYSERVVVRERPGYYPQPYRGYWGPPPGAYYGRGWRH
jgi:hypothetical protein